MATSQAVREITDQDFEQLMSSEQPVFVDARSPVHRGQLGEGLGARRPRGAGLHGVYPPAIGRRITTRSASTGSWVTCSAWRCKAPWCWRA